MPTLPNVCRVSFSTINLSGVIDPDVEFRFSLLPKKSTETAGGFFVKTHVVTSSTDASGNGFADLIVSSELSPNDDGEEPAYRVVCKDYSLDANIVVPNQANADLIDLIPS